MIKGILNNKGSTEALTAAIMIPLVLVIFGAVTVLFLELLTPFVIYSKMSGIVRKYVFSAENNGGFSTLEKNNLLNDLEDKGIPRTRVTITTSPALDVKAKYGSFLSISVDYNYNLRLLDAITTGNTLSFTKVDRPIDISIHKTGVSRLVQ